MKKSYSLLVMLITILGACTSDELIPNEVTYQYSETQKRISSQVTLGTLWHWRTTLWEQISP